MQKATGLILTTLAALTLSACATMNEDECIYSDWGAIGYEDGVRGMTGDRIGQHRKACAKHGVTPDLTAYQDGRQLGLREYCRPENGFRVGSSGAALPTVCAGEQSADFADAYREGRELHVLQSKVRGADSQIRVRKAELEDIADDLASREALLIAEGTTGEQRTEALAETKRLNRRQGELEAEILQLERDKVLHQQALNEYQSRLTYRL
jgi:hypothetical protein